MTAPAKLTAAQRRALTLIRARANYMIEKYGSQGTPAVRAKRALFPEGTCGVVHVPDRTAVALARRGFLEQHGAGWRLTPAGRAALEGAS